MIATMHQPLTPEAELQALKDLVACDGWDVYQQHIAQAWGPEAYELAIDRALEGTPTDEEHAITRRIRDTFKGVRADATWVPKRIAELEAALKHKPTSIVDRFAHLRRVAAR